jgi:hypothetical protein
MKRWLPLLCLALVGCGPKAPDDRLMLWEQPSPEIAARAHATEIRGIALGIEGQSMEPFLAAGDWIVADIRLTFDTIKVRDVCIYTPDWLPGKLVCHMTAAKSGDEWIMDGINNPSYENGGLRMKRENYKGRMVQGYSKRKKP